MSNKIVVATLYRLGKAGDSFNKDFKTKLRSKAKVSEDYVNTVNANWKTAGQLYVIDEKATKERDELVAPQTLDRDALKKQADDMGLEYAKNIKTEKLADLIKEKE
jgi:gamma-glutamylcyclotransferase (GGCT)/AIG2-like uncharacterized protein YtfP